MAVDLRERGLRNPRHTFAVAHGGKKLVPLFIAPLRPMETMIGLRARINSMSYELMRTALTLPVEVEYCVWKVSVRQIGEFFIDTFVNDLEDVESQAVSGTDGTTATNIAPSPISSQGQQSRTPLQTRDRVWAGEMGQAGAEPTVISNRSYAPYVSHAIWHIARMAYELEIGNQTTPRRAGQTNGNQARTSVNLYQNPPVVGRLVRGALASAMGAGLANTPDNAITTSSLSDWAERLSVVDNPNRTYFDYLKAFGVHPSKIPGMPEPVLMQRRLLRPHGTPATVWNPQTFAAPPSPPASFATFDSTHRMHLDEAATSPNGYALVDGNAYQSFSAAIDETRGKRLVVDEPSFLIGTACWWPWDFDITSGAHVFDATYMINSGTWGDPSKGSPDERDFLITRDVKQALAGVGQFFQTDDQTFGSWFNDNNQSGPFAINMLNLFLNGDSYTNSVKLFGQHRSFDGNIRSTSGNEVPFVDPGGDGIDNSSYMLWTKGDVRIGVATDLVA
jgi:hypothetical protein